MTRPMIGAAALAAVGLAGARAAPRLLGADSFMPHGHCYRWLPGLLAIHVGSDLLIGLSYVAISVTLTCLVWRARARIPFRGIFLLFGGFIVACGAGHFAEAWVVWSPHYWLSGTIKLVTAGLSAGTAIALVVLLPSMLALIVRIGERDVRIARVLDVTGAGTWVWDLGGRVLEWDASLEPLHGFAPGAFDGRFEDAIARIHPADREWVRAEMRRAVQRDEDLDLEYRVTTLGGDERMLAMFGRLIRDGDGRPVRMAGMSWDVTALHAAEAQFRAIVDAAPSAMIMVAPDGRVELVNPRAEDLFGRPAHELVDASIDAVIPQGQAEVDAALRGAFLGRPSGAAPGGGKPVWGMRADGATVPIEIELTLVRRRRGPHVLVSVVDLSERRRWADDVRQLNLELERTIEELEGANREMESFVYSVSHDLRAPLRAVDGYTRMFVEKHAGGVGAEGRRLLDVVSANARRMGKLIDDLLALSRLGRQELTRAPVDLTALAEAIVRQLRELSPERAVRVEIDDLPPASGDAGMIQQVLSNLIGNAWKFTGRTPEAAIAVGARAANGEIAYFVRDNGAGFNQAYADKLFGVFQRLHPSDEFEGNGIGLVIVQRIVERHGGRVWAEGQVGQGATFHFTLGAPSAAEVRDAG